MQTGITGEPTSPPCASPPPELTYRLRVEDLVAYWVYLGCHAHRLLPRAVVTRLRRPASVLHFAGLAGVVVAGGLLDQALPGPWPLKTAAALSLAGLTGALVAEFVLAQRPDRLLGGGRATALHRWLALRSLYALARPQADSGALDTAAIWR